MAVFSIYRGATTLYSWDIESGGCVYANPTWAPQGQVVLSEKDGYGFIVDPAEDGLEYHISVGDVPVGELVPYDATGWAMEARRVWPQQQYFDSARGATPVVLKTRDEDSESERWLTQLQVLVDVIPSKIGDDAFQAMAADLQAISRGLLVDLYGKSSRTYELRYAARTRTFHSKEEELESIAMAVDRLSALVGEIQRSPASRLQRKSSRAQYWGTERLDNAGLMDLARRGVSVRSPVRPIPVLQTRLIESFDIVEHRMLKAFIAILLARAEACIRAVGNHIDAIHAERGLRNVKPRGLEGPTLYESIDVPKLRRLRDAMRQAEHLKQVLKTIQDCSFLQGVEPSLGPIEGGVFQRNPLYRELFSLMARFLGSEALLVEGDDFSTVTKLTWRLFEQWSLVHVVNAFRDAGMVLKEWDESLRQHVAARFILDFERGLSFEGVLTPGLRLKIRYEPWILGEAAATQLNETLCRGSSENVAWSPDIVVELLDERRGLAEPIYAIVLDCKYTRRINEHHVSETSKYFEIRSTHARRQVVHQLWLIHLGTDDAITCRDPAVVFNEDGPSSMLPEEHGTFVMSVVPRSMASGADESVVAPRMDAFRTFAVGTVNFFKREFV